MFSVGMMGGWEGEVLEASIRCYIAWGRFIQTKFEETNQKLYEYIEQKSWKKKGLK